MPLRYASAKDSPAVAGRALAAAGCVTCMPPSLQCAYIPVYWHLSSLIEHSNPSCGRLIATITKCSMQVWIGGRRCRMQVGGLHLHAGAAYSTAVGGRMCEQKRLTLDWQQWLPGTKPRANRPGLNTPSFSQLQHSCLPRCWRARWPADLLKLLQPAAQAREVLINPRTYRLPMDMWRVNAGRGGTLRCALPLLCAPARACASAQKRPATPGRLLQLAAPCQPPRPGASACAWA